MVRFLIAFYLFLCSLFIVFFVFYIPSKNIQYSLYNAFPYYAPLAAFCLTCTLTIKTAETKKLPIFGALLFALTAMTGEFYLREVIIPSLFAEPISTPDPKEFLLNGHPNSKKGLLVSSISGTYIFGEIIKIPSGYMARNFSFFSSSNRTEAPFIRTEENRIIALNLRVITENATNINQGPTELLLPFSLDAFYSVWGNKSPQNVPLLGVLENLEIFKNNHNLLGPYKKPLYLAIGRYIITFVFLLFVSIFGMSVDNSLEFKGWGSLGAFAFFILVFPLAALIHYYMIYIVNVLINSFI